MDPVTMVFYAVVCGALAAIAPNLGPRMHRAVYGIVVGAIAAVMLPFLRGLLGL